MANLIPIIYIKIQKEVKGIGLFRKKSGKKTDGKPVAVAFVDYEHWYISMNKLYNMKPNIQGWIKEMNEKYDVKEVTFFADFSNLSLSNEIPRIREVTNNIIQTTNAGAHYKKDFTDFIMLDHIYQRAMSADDVDTFIIFSGDGHFSSVVSCLKNKCRKDVGIYGIKDAFSTQLKNTASWYTELPNENEAFAPYYQMILNNLKNLENKRYRNAKPTYARTVEVVSEFNSVSPEKVKQGLDSLINKGYILKEDIRVDSKKVTTLKARWHLLIKDNIWQTAQKRIKKDDNNKKSLPKVVRTKKTVTKNITR